MSQDEDVFSEESCASDGGSDPSASLRAGSFATDAKDGAPRDFLSFGEIDPPIAHNFCRTGVSDPHGQCSSQLLNHPAILSGVTASFREWLASLRMNKR